MLKIMNWVEIEVLHQGVKWPAHATYCSFDNTKKFETQNLKFKTKNKLN